MLPMTYTVDLQKIRSTLLACAYGSVFALLLAIVGLLLGYLAPEEGVSSLLLIALAIVVVSAGVAVSTARRLPTARNLLSVDRHGLTLMRRGRTRVWRWADISPVRLQGRIATFRAEAGGYRCEERLEDIYATPLAEIVDRLNACRTLRPAAEGASDGAEEPDPGPSLPTIHYGDPAALGHRRKRDLLWLLFSFALVPVMYVVLSREAQSAFGLDPMVVLAVLGGVVALLLAIVVPVLLFASGRRGNLLHITDEGLTWISQGTMIRQWRWQDLSAFEVRGAAAEGASGIAFSAADDGKPFQGMGLLVSPWGRSASFGWLSFKIEEIYDSPVESIAADLNARRNRALGEAQTAQGAQPLAVDAGRRAIGFQKDLQDLWRLGVVGQALWIGGLVWLPVMLLLGWPFEIFASDGITELSAWQRFLSFLDMFVLIALIAEILILMREFTPADNALGLDKGGLTVTRGGRRRRWAWGDLSAFEVKARKAFGFFRPRSVIVFDAPGGYDLRSRFLRLCYRLSGRAPAMVIEDIYDTPLDEIAARLNDFRAQPAGGAAPGA